MALLQKYRALGIPRSILRQTVLLKKPYIIYVKGSFAKIEVSFVELTDI